MREKLIRVKLLTGNPLPNRTTFCLGSTGSGKSTLSAQFLLAAKRFVAFDVKGEYAHLPHILSLDNFTQFVEALNNGIERIVFNPQRYSDKLEMALDAILFHLFDFQRANSHLGTLLFSLDELQQFAQSGEKPISGLKEIVMRGRGYGIEKLFSAQYFGTVPPFMRDSFSEAYVFRHNDPNSLVLLKQFGFNTEEVISLPPYTCVHYDKVKFTRCRCVADNGNGQTNKTIATEETENEQLQGRV